MRETLAALFDFYRRPLAAPSRAMDECSLPGAALAAILVCLLLGFTGASQAGKTLPSGPTEQPSASQSSPDDEAGPDLARNLPRSRHRQSWQERIPIPSAGFRTLILLAIVFVPSAILIFVLWKGPGGFSTILMRDYAPTLLCLLLAWTAAFLPIVLIRFSPIPMLGSFDALSIGGFIYFAFLAACCIRTVMGVGFGSAALISAGAYLLSFAGLVAFGLLGNTIYYLASPWFLFYFYRQFQSGAAQLSFGLSSRQNLRRSLAVSALNPRDADAQYQLGLIYSSRRQYTEAINRLNQAVEIDPRDPAPRYELGRIALDQSRYQDAFDHFYVAAEIDPTHAANAVWRDIGIACWHLNDFSNALAALERYVARREYDPEGLYWLGKSLASLNRTDDAAAAWRRAVDAARSMPSHRRRLMSKWASKANAELNAVGARRA